MIIRTSDELFNICERANYSEYITVDTEFVRRKGALYPEASLIQFSIDGRTGYICDLLDKTIDLKPLYDLFLNQKVIKVFHSFQQDLHIIYKLFQIVPVNLFDVQIGSMFLGGYNNPSYNLLIDDFLGIKLDKALQFSNWITRPLSTRQLEYASRDVTYLFDLFPLIRERLGYEKYSWAKEEMDNISKYDLNSIVKDRLEKNALKVLYKRKHINPRYLWLLEIGLTWREEQSLKRNIVRDKIIDSIALTELIYKIDKYFDGFDRSKILLNKNLNQLLDKIELTLDQGMNLDWSNALVELTIKKREILHKRPELYLNLKDILKESSHNSSINQNLIGDKSDMVSIAARNALTPKFSSGWRYQVFGSLLKFG